MKLRATLVLVVLAVLAVPLTARLALGKKIDCSQVGKGVGYYLFFYRDVPMFQKLDPAAASAVEAMVGKVLKEKAAAAPGTPADLAAPPIGLTQAQAVKIGMGGTTYEFQGKPIGEALKKAGLGYAYCLVFYSTNIGPKDINKPLTSGMEELPTLDLNDNGATIKVFNFINLRVNLIDAEGKDVAKGKESIFSYRDWFTKKYPDFMSGRTSQLPEGVAYDSAAQYALFISESLQTLLDALPEHKALASCPKEAK